MKLLKSICSGYNIGGEAGADAFTIQKIAGHSSVRKIPEAKGVPHKDSPQLIKSQSDGVLSCCI